ncbi:MAG: HAMP domain-containing sensor histidine kinase [Bacteroidota bacterium]
MKVYRSYITFFLFLFYFIGFCALWSYLLFSKNKNLYDARSELVEKSARLSAPTDSIAIQQIIAGKQDLDVEFKRQRRVILVESLIFFLSIIIGIYVVFRGLRNEVAVNRQQQNFLQSITHELKSPIASIRLVLETFKKRDLGKEQIHKFTGNALKDVERLQNLVDNLLLATRIENAYTWALDDIDLIELTERIITKMRQKHPNVDFKTRYTAEKIVIRADKTAFTSLAVNLLENAVKYSPKDIAEIKVTVRKGTKNFDFEVADNGIGIPEEERDRVFEKFYRIGSENTRKTKGTGLGLHIVKEIVKAHRGYIHVKENQPEGTIIRVTMPIKLTKVND